IFAPALMGFFFARAGHLERRFYLSFAALAVVGFGSAAFHGTLLKTAQLADELPMLHASCCFLFCLADAKWTARGSPLRLWLVAVLVVLAFGTTAAYLYTNDPIVHEVCYAFLVGGIVIRSFFLARVTRDARLRRLLRSSVVWYFTGFAVWNIDNLACATLTRIRDALAVHPYLWPLGPVTEMHAWWHVGVGVGSYMFIVYASACRAETLGVAFDIQVRVYVKQCFFPSHFLYSTSLGSCRFSAR
ncbi:MAG: ceramidase domain-containing protein, partial [Usitatibacteraceae bacterium]